MAINRMLFKAKRKPIDYSLQMHIFIGEGDAWCQVDLAEMQPEAIIDIFQNAMDAYKNALSCYCKSKSESSIAVYLYRKIGFCYENMLVHFQKIKPPKTKEELKEHDEIQKLYKKYACNHYKAALTSLENTEGLSQVEIHQNKVVSVETYLSLATIYKSRGDLKKALMYALEKGLPLNKTLVYPDNQPSLKDLKRELSGLNTVIGCFQQLENPKMAIQYYQRAIAICREAKIHYDESIMDTTTLEYFLKEALESDSDEKPYESYVHHEKKSRRFCDGFFNSNSSQAFTSENNSDNDNPHPNKKSKPNVDSDRSLSPTQENRVVKPANILSILRQQSSTSPSHTESTASTAQQNQPMPMKSS